MPDDDAIDTGAEITPSQAEPQNIESVYEPTQANSNQAPEQNDYWFNRAAELEAQLYEARQNRLQQSQPQSVSQPQSQQRQPGETRDEWEDRIEQLVANQLKPVNEFITQSREQAQQAQYRQQHEAYASQFESHASVFCDHLSRSIPAAKDDPDLAADVKADVLERVRTTLQKNPGMQLTTADVRSAYDKEIQKALKIKSRYHAKTITSAQERVPGQNVKSMAGGKPAAAGGKSKDLDYSSDEDVEAAMNLWKKRGS